MRPGGGCVAAVTKMNVCVSKDSPLCFKVCLRVVHLGPALLQQGYPTVPFAVHCDITQWDPIHSRVIIQWQPITHTSSTEAFALIEVHMAAGGEHINRATFVIGGKDRDPAPVGNHPGVFHVQQTCRHR